MNLILYILQQALLLHISTIIVSLIASIITEYKVTYDILHNNNYTNDEKHIIKTNVLLIDKHDLLEIAKNSLKPYFNMRYAMSTILNYSTYLEFFQKMCDCELEYYKLLLNKNK